METTVSDLFADLDRGPAAAKVVVSSSSVAESPTRDASPPVQVVSRSKKLSVEQQREQTLKTIEADLFQQAMQVTLDSLKFAEVEWDQDEPPQEWVDQLEYSYPGRGYELAMQKLRTAKAGNMSKKDAPIAIQVAQAITVGISRSRAQLSAGPKTLNVQLVQLPASVMPDFPELLLTAGEK